MRVELSKEGCAGWFVDEGGAEGFAVAGLKIVIGPLELVAEAGVFTLECDVGDGAGVSADAEWDAGAIEAVDGVVGVGEGGAGLYVAGRADFEVDVAVGEMLDECGVFNAADAVADAGWLEGFEGFPNAAGACGFSGVGGAV